MNTEFLQLQNDARVRMDAQVQDTAQTDARVVQVQDMVTVQICVEEGGRPPVQVHEGDIGWSLFSAEEVTLFPYSLMKVDTGVRVAVPAGYELQVRSRSGLAAQYGITVLNSPGTVDRGYRGTIHVILFNNSDDAFHVKQGMAIAQAVVCPVPVFRFETVPDASMLPPPPDTRAEGGFGSTGLMHT